MRWKSLQAKVLLGGHFILRSLRRLFFMKSAGLPEFLRFYREDRLPSLTHEDKKLLTGAHRCISCGLCDFLCPALLQAKDFLGPSFFPHLSRSIPDFAGVVRLDLAECAGCRGCEAICPEKVPIKKIIGFMKEKGGMVA